MERELTWNVILPKWVKGFAGGCVHFRCNLLREMGPNRRGASAFFQDANISLIITSTNCWNVVFHSLLFKMSSPRFRKHLVIQYWSQVPQSFQAEVLYFYFWEVQSLCSSNPFTLKINSNLLFQLEQSVWKRFPASSLSVGPAWFPGFRSESRAHHPLSSAPPFKHSCDPWWRWHGRVQLMCFLSH